MALAMVAVAAPSALGAPPSMPDCTDSEWGCELAHDPPEVVGSNTAITFASDGSAWVSFRHQDEEALMVARYVGSGGDCTNPAWECTVVDDPISGNNVGFETDLAFDAGGVLWVSYQDTTTDDLKVAHLKPDEPASGGCAAGWLCEAVDTATQVGGYSAIAIVGGAPLVTYWDAANNDLRYARYRGDGAGNCDDPDWDCGVVDSGPVGAFANDLEVDPTGTVWAAYRYAGQGQGPTSAKLVVASYVGQGGSGCGGGSPEWNCTAVTKTANVGLDPGIAFDGDGRAWVHYWNNDNLNLAHFVGNGSGSCTEDADWQCETIHDEGDSVGEYGAIAFDESGTAWIAYHGRTQKDAYVARYVGGGSGSGCGPGGSADWVCSTLDSFGDVGQFWMGIAVDPDGLPWVSYFDATNGGLKIAALKATDSPPTVSIVSPAVGSTVSGTVTVEVDAMDSEDAAGTLTVDVAIDGGTWQPTTYNATSGSYELSWDTTAVADGSHTIDARATDSAANTGTAPQVKVTVDNVNDPPKASFTYSCTELACDFDASGSSDPDGTIQRYAWDFGDGATATGVTVSHTYAASGTYTVTLTVTDDDGAAGSESRQVTVSEASGITLTATGYKVKGLQKADLEWSGATSANVDVYRNGVLLATTENDGLHTDHIDQRGGGSYTYQVCETGTSTCSNEATVSF